MLENDLLLVGKIFQLLIFLYICLVVPQVLPTGSGHQELRFVLLHGYFITYEMAFSGCVSSPLKKHIFCILTKKILH